ncbi:chemotaxis protein LafU [Steroidobacter agaridevorans]|uniref:Chemotaxis protein LafU n=1 Tax=Steroidobacter agaridevorans TaxID=2695856 RepID=A0A829YLZ1_9GAMM|nr:OmpA family protein [Steroidobacter agaridevorans]GFE84387.1 chemotaxis protein LafU [Steroidobacter agaridevorans]GFE87207.1 chemotaxis protein LafU [Steroidobacter agaridevorans]
MLNKLDKGQQTIVKRVSRGHGDEGHGGAAWKVAFADFCLALLSLFLVMWLMASRQAEHMEDLLKAAGGTLVDEGRGRMSMSMGGPRGSLIDRNPLPSDGDTLSKRAANTGESEPAGPGEGLRLSKAHYESHADMLELSEVLKALGAEVGLSSNIRTIITPYGLRVLMHDTDKQGMFQVGSSSPNERFRRLLKKLGPVFKLIDNQLLIVGHTDSLQYADRSYTAFSNWTLSSERAMAARSYLLAGGMPTKSVLQVVGQADTAPINPDNTAASENRRIELLILTRGQAHSIAQMFGSPTDTMPLLGDDVSTSLPDSAALEELRGQLHNRDM